MLDFLPQVATCCEQTADLRWGTSRSSLRDIADFAKDGDCSGSERSADIDGSVRRRSGSCSPREPLSESEERLAEFVRTLQARELELAAKLAELETCRAQLSSARTRLQDPEVNLERDELSRRAMLLRVVSRSSPMRISRADIAKSGNPDSIKDLLAEVRSSTVSVFSVDDRDEESFVSGKGLRVPAVPVTPASRHEAEADPSDRPASAADFSGRQSLCPSSTDEGEDASSGSVAARAADLQERLDRVARERPAEEGEEGGEAAAAAEKAGPAGAVPVYSLSPHCEVF